MLIKTKSIVLHTLKYGESTLIVHLYTEKQGRVAAIVKGVLGKKNRMSSSYFNTLNILDSELYYIPGRNLQRIREVHLHYPYHTIPFNIRKSAIMLFLGDILKQTLTEEEKNPSLFYWLITSLQMFDQMEEGFTDFHVAFLIHLTRYLGFHPQNNYTPENSYFDLREGVFVPLIPLHQEYMDKPLSKHFYEYLVTPLGEKKFSVQGSYKKVLGKVVQYYQIHLEGINAISSLEILKSVFQDPSP